MQKKICFHIPVSFLVLSKFIVREIEKSLRFFSFIENEKNWKPRSTTFEIYPLWIVYQNYQVVIWNLYKFQFFTNRWSIKIVYLNFPENFRFSFFEIWPIGYGPRIGGLNLNWSKEVKTFVRGYFAEKIPGELWRIRKRFLVIGEVLLKSWFVNFWEKDIGEHLVKFCDIS